MLEGKNVCLIPFGGSFGILSVSLHHFIWNLTCHLIIGPEDCRAGVNYHITSRFYITVGRNYGSKTESAFMI